MKRVIITGGNFGIGKAAAKSFALMDFEIILACRDMEKAEEVKKEIQEEFGNNNVYPMKVDLSDMEDVKRFVSEYKEKFDSLDVLINNASNADYTKGFPEITVDGYEKKFAVNHLAPFILVNSFLQLLKESGDGRIINVASKGLMMYPRLDFEPNSVYGSKDYSPFKAYYHSKLAQLMFSFDLSERLKDTGITVYCVRVVNTATDVTRYGQMHPALQKMYDEKLKSAVEPERIGDIYVALATGEKVKGVFINEYLKEVKALKPAYKKATWQKLWSLSEEMTGVGFGL